MLQDSGSSNYSQARYDGILNRVHNVPTDVKSWLELVDVARESKDGNQVSKTYEALIKAFPNTVCFLRLVTSCFHTQPSASRQWRSHTLDGCLTLRLQPGINSWRACSEGFSRILHLWNCGSFTLHMLGTFYL